jgi:hypothetical protein
MSRPPVDATCEDTELNRQKLLRGSASQYFVAGELCRRGMVAVITMGNCPNTDILCSNIEANKFVHIQVKTFRPGNRTCSVGQKAENPYGENFFWVLGGIPTPGTNTPFEYYVIPAPIMSKNVLAAHELWVKTPGRKGQAHDAESKVRTVHLPPRCSRSGWRIDEFKDRWDLIEAKLR